MTQNDQQQLGKILWSIADDLRGSMNADDFRHSGLHPGPEEVQEAG